MSLITTNHHRHHSEHKTANGTITLGEGGGEQQSKKTNKPCSHTKWQRTRYMSATMKKVGVQPNNKTPARDVAPQALGHARRIGIVELHVRRIDVRLFGIPQLAQHMFYMK